MNLENTANSIRSRFGTLFEDLHAGIPVIYDNQLGDDAHPDIDGPFVRLKIDWADGILAGLGNPRLFRDLGVISIQIFVPAGEGDKELLELADDAGAVFQSVTADGVVYRQPRFQPLGQEGAFYQGNVLCRFYADFTAT